MRSSQSRRAERARLIERPFAHRGLHGAAAPENSRAAFHAAIAKGHGIELDVQASRDGVAMVFHDARLERLTGRTGSVADFTAAELSGIALKGTDETIAALSDIMALIDERAPLLIEVKAPGRDVGALCRSVASAIAGYNGPMAVMSFNPGVGRWFARHVPGALRGLVVSEDGKPRRGRLRRWLSLRWARPDFLAYDIRDLPSRFAAAARARGLLILTWTCRSATDLATAAAHADQIIYEIPLPE